MDRLTNLLNQFSMRTGVFYTGKICGIHDFDQDPEQGHIHVIRRGPVHLTGLAGEPLDIIEPTIIFLPRPESHRLISDLDSGADVVCANLRFGGGGRNPITDSLPPVVKVELASIAGASALLDLIFDEAFRAQGGGQAILDRLCEVLMIRLLRYCVEEGITKSGTLAGLADKRLARALSAIHDNPATDWDLATLAGLADMSRARFAVRFKQVTGDTPADYLATWRLVTAQKLLAHGEQLKRVASQVGYGSASALTRAFVRRFACSPTAWLEKYQRLSRKRG